MLSERENKPLDYLMIGHLTIDRTPGGASLGGTALYSALTARAMGMDVAILTSWGEELDFSILQDIDLVNIRTSKSTTFENISTESGRLQRIFRTASSINPDQIPPEWKTAKIVHLGPVAQEISYGVIDEFNSSFIAVTPQGWMRDWDQDGWVKRAGWQQFGEVLPRVEAAVISMEDVGGDENILAEMASICPALAVTEGAEGVRMYWNGDVRRFKPPNVESVDTTGAGDIFAAALFCRLYATRDPWGAARFATNLAAYSVTRTGILSIPTESEIKKSMVEIL
jgi:sugar/nucleoside kinase (ribokinase family)